MWMRATLTTIAAAIGLAAAGDRLMLSLSAPSWKPERARITIRNGRSPSVELLGA